MQVATEQKKQFTPADQDTQISKHSHPDHWFNSTTSNQLKFSHSHSSLTKNQERQEGQSSQKWWQSYQ